MGASSVTGVSGNGAVRGMKGPGNNRNFWVSNVCPHVVAAGEGTLDEGELVVVFPQSLEKSADDYVVVVTAVGSVLGVSVAKDETDEKMSGFTVTGTGDYAVMWAVMNKGYGIEATVPDAR